MTRSEGASEHVARSGRIPARRGRVRPRHLTRVFREATGVSIREYRTRLRLERARDLLRDPNLTLETVTVRCGFEGARQLRRLRKDAFGAPPSSSRI